MSQCGSSDFSCRYNAVCETYPLPKWTIFEVFIFGYSTMVSCVITFTGLVLYQHPQLQRHPYKIYALACISEGIYFSNLNVYKFVCSQNYPVIFMQTLNLVTGQTSDEVKYWILYGLILIGNCIFYFGLCQMMVFNFLIYLDLYLTIKNPFHPRELRIKYYYSLSMFVFVSIVTIQF